MWGEEKSRQHQRSLPQATTRQGKRCPTAPPRQAPELHRGICTCGNKGGGSNLLLSIRFLAVFGDSQSQEYANDKTNGCYTGRSQYIAAQLIHYCKRYRKDQPFEQCGSILLHQVLYPSMSHLLFRVLPGNSDAQHCSALVFNWQGTGFLVAQRTTCERYKYSKLRADSQMRPARRMLKDFHPE